MKSINGNPELNKLFARINKSIEDLQEEVRFPNEFKSTITELVKELNVFQQEKFEINIDFEAFESIGRSLNEYTQNISDNILLISRHGWFIDFVAPIDLPAKSFNLFNSSKIKERNKLNECKKLKEGNMLIERYYHENIDNIFETLKKRHKRRKLILDEILKGYKENNYRLIIPCIFSQIDGISNDFTKKAFFKKEAKNKYLPVITPLIEAQTEGFLKLYISPLQNQTPIMANEKELEDFPCQFNRHQVIHGSSVSYGNKTNSLKAISFLKYLSDILTSLKSKGKIT
jgi:hypothetical protein